MNPNEGPTRDAYLNEIEDGIRSIIRWSRRHSSQLAHELYQGLDLTALTILAALGEHPESRLTSLAEWLKLDLSNASRQTTLLESAGLVARTTDPDDRRSTLLSLTPQGRTVLAKARQDSTTFMHQVYKDWGTGELATFASMLMRTIDAIDEIHSLKQNSPQRNDATDSGSTQQTPPEDMTP